MFSNFCCNSPPANIVDMLQIVRLLTGSIARSAKRRLFNLLSQTAILRFFAPQGRHVAPMGVQFGTEKGTECPLLPVKCHPHRCNNKGVGPPKQKFLPKHDQSVEYKRPAGASLARYSQNLQNWYLV